MPGFFCFRIRTIQNLIFLKKNFRFNNNNNNNNIIVLILLYRSVLGYFYYIIVIARDLDKKYESKKCYTDDIKIKNTFQIFNFIYNLNHNCHNNCHFHM